MKLKDVELLPGVVIENKDPLHRCRVKASVPGVFDARIMSEEGMPWICPLMMFGNQTYSRMEIGSKIWLFKIEDNMRELWYVPMFQMQTNTHGIAGAGEDSDVLACRSNGQKSFKIEHSPSKGLDMSVNGNAQLNLNADGTANLKAGSTNLNMSGSKVTIGDASTAQEMILGQNLKTKLTDLKKSIGELKDLANASSETEIKLLVPAITGMESSLDGLEEILSQNGKVS